MASFKDRLKIALRKANMNQETLARLTGIRKGLFPQWKSGKAKPKIETARKMAEILGVDANWLRGDDVDESETKLIENYRKLNDLGQEKAFEYVEDLSEQEKYTIKTDLPVKSSKKSNFG